MNKKTIDRATPAAGLRRLTLALLGAAAMAAASGQALAVAAPLSAKALSTVTISAATPLVQEDIKNVGSFVLTRSQVQTLQLPAGTTAGYLSGPLVPPGTAVAAGDPVAYIVYAAGDVVAENGAVGDLPPTATPIVTPVSGTLTAYIPQNNLGSVINVLAGPGTNVATVSNPDYTGAPLTVNYTSPADRTLTVPAFGLSGTTPTGYLYLRRPNIPAGVKINTVDNQGFTPNATTAQALQCITNNTCQIVAWVIDNPNVTAATPTDGSPIPLCPSGGINFQQCPYPITVPKGATLQQLYKTDGALATVSYFLGIYSLDGEAVSGVDYVPIPGTATFPIGAGSVTVEVIPKEDSDPTDGNEALTVTLSNNGNYLVGGGGSATVTLVETPTVTVTATPATLASGQNQITPGTFTFTRSGDLGQAMPMELTLGGSAVQGTDYTLSGPDYSAPATITIPAGQASSALTVNPIAHGSAVTTVTVSALSFPLAAPAAGFLSGPFVRPVSVGKPVAYVVANAADVVAADGCLCDLPADAVVVPMPQYGTGSSGTVTAVSMVKAVGDGVQAGDTIAKLAVDQPASLVLAATLVSPAVTIQPTQGGAPRRLIVKSGGDVTAQAQVTDANPGDTFHYDWSATDNALVAKGGTTGSSFVFDPSGLQSGFYTLRVKVTDSTGRSTEAPILIKIVDSLPNLDNDADLDNQGTHIEDPLDDVQDSDGDGIPDATEGYTDSDYDGIPDFQDADTLAANALQEVPLVADQFLMTTDQGLSLGLGDTAFAAGHGSAQIDAADLQQYGGPGAGAGVNTTGGAPGTGPYVDFVVSGLAQAGMSADVVITQQQSLPAGARFRVYHPGSGWRDFVENGANKVWSCCSQASLDQFNSGQSASTPQYGNTGNYPGSNGNCPAAGSSLYTPGLSQGATCVQLTIEDGGPNDTDGTANHIITDPGAIVGTASGASSGGSGDLDLITALALAGLYGSARRNRRR